MQIINYFLASIISYLGLLLGIILIKIAPEEQKPGKKYFTLLKKITFFFIVFFILIFYKLNIVILFIILFLLLFMLLNKKIKLEKSPLVYFIFGTILYIGKIDINLFIIESVLIFLYGVPEASSTFNIKKKNYKDIFLKNLLFFIPIILLYFIF